MTETTKQTISVDEVFPTPPHTDKSHKSNSSSSEEEHKLEPEIKKRVEPDGTVTLSVTLLVPVQKYPKYNFVGRILGPRGMTAKQLERDTGCKILVKGRGSTKTYNPSTKISRGGNYLTSLSTISQDALTNDPLNVFIECTDVESMAQKKLRKAMEVIQNLLTPPADGKDELKRKQLIDYAIINGTFRQTSSTLNRDKTQSADAPEEPKEELRAGDAAGDAVFNAEDDVESMKTVKMLLDSHKYYIAEEQEPITRPAFEPYQETYYQPQYAPMRNDGVYLTGPYTYYPCEPQQLPPGPVYPLPHLIYMLPSNFQVFDQFIRRY